MWQPAVWSVADNGARPHPIPSSSYWQFKELTLCGTLSIVTNATKITGVQAWNSISNK